MPESQDDLADLDSAGSPKQTKREQKKNRKPYTITKPRESWTDEEHDLFLEALQLFEREWKQIEAHIKTKTVIQIRSHAQKYFQKMQKTGKQDCIPPPRPKRRSKKPYPKIVRDRKPTPISNKSTDFSTLTQGSVVNQDYMNASYPFSSPTPSIVHQMPPPRTIVGQHPTNIGNSLQFALFEREQLAQLHQEQLAQAQFYLQQAVAAHITDDKKPDMGGAAKTPNFQKIYSFLGSLFDPSTTGHVEQLRLMNDIDRQVVQLLMQNLASNLSKQHAIGSEFSSSQEAVVKDVYMLNNDHKAMMPSSTRPGAMPMDQSIPLNAHVISNEHEHGSPYPGASTSTL